MPTAKEMSILSSHAEALHSILNVLRSDTFVQTKEGALDSAGTHLGLDSRGAQAFCWMNDNYSAVAAMIKVAESVAYQISEGLYECAEAMTQEEFNKEKKTA